MSDKQPTRLELIFMSPTRLMEETPGKGGLLSRLLRRIWYDSPNIDASWVFTRIGEYVHREREAARLAGRDPKKLHLSVSALRREMEGDTLTWKRFIQALQVQDYDGADITVGLRRRGKTTYHSISVDLKDPNMQTTEDE